MIEEFDPSVLKHLYKPPQSSHKGQNGKLMLIGGSELFHAASLWALTVASRIVDMVFYASVDVNNKIVENLKTEFRNGIVVPRSKVDSYMQEADCILIGPGLPRPEGQEKGDDDTRELTENLLRKYPQKRWVIDGGSLQVIEPSIIPKTAIITPHRKEFDTLKLKTQNSKLPTSPRLGGASKTVTAKAGSRLKTITGTIQSLNVEDQIQMFAKEYGFVVLLKGPYDIVAAPDKSVKITGGNAGMTKGGTGDVLAGLAAALYCKNEAFLSAAAASYINKKAAESLYKRVGPYFNASDLADEIPQIMKNL